jgi:hypothetical protein
MAGAPAWLYLHGLRQCNSSGIVECCFHDLTLIHFLLRIFKIQHPANPSTSRSLTARVRVGHDAIGHNTDAMDLGRTTSPMPG